MNIRALAFLIVLPGLVCRQHTTGLLSVFQQSRPRERSHDAKGRQGRPQEGLL